MLQRASSMTCSVGSRERLRPGSLRARERRGRAGPELGEVDKDNNVVLYSHCHCQCQGVDCTWSKGG